MSVITRGAHPKALWPGVHRWFGAKYDEHAVEYTMLFDNGGGSNKAYEEDAQHFGFGLVPQKDEGQPVTYDANKQGFVYRYTHVAYGLGYIVTKEQIDDTLYTEVSKKNAGLLAFSSRQTKENVAAQVYNNGFDSSYTFGDGKEWFAMDHPDAIGGTQSNETTGAALSESALEDICTAIMKAKNPKGLQISLQPTRLIVPPDLIFDAHRILKSTFKNSDDTNAINALKSMGSIPEIAMNHYLTSATRYFVRTNAPAGPTYFDRNPMEFTQDNDFDTENAKAKCYERYSFGVSDWRGAWGNEGA